MQLKRTLLIAFATLITGGVLAQNTNPYAIFGYEATNEITYKNNPWAVYLRVKNLDTTSIIKELAFDFRYGYVYFYGENNLLLKEVNVPPDRLLRFISIDPKAGNFPWNSPYAFAENDVIRAIDLNGLEKYIRTYNNFRFEFDDQLPQQVSITKMTADDVQQTIVLNFNALNQQFGTSSLSLFAPHTSQQIASVQGFQQSPFFRGSTNQELAKNIYEGSVQPSLQQLKQRFGTDGEFATRVLAEFIGQSNEVQLNIVGNFEFLNYENVFMLTNDIPLYARNRRQAVRLFTEQRPQKVADAFFSPGGTVPGGILTHSRLDVRRRPVGGLRLRPIGKDPFGATLYFKYNFQGDPAPIPTTPSF